MPGVEFDRERLRDSITPELFATAEALRLVNDGVPFRDAYRNAAAGVNSLEAPDAATALYAYAIDGYPGRCRPDIIRKRLARHDDWLDAPDGRS